MNRKLVSPAKRSERLWLFAVAVFCLGFGLTVGASQPTLIVSEFMAANDSVLQNPQGDYEDWVELHNFGDQPLALAAFYLTDSRKNPMKWRLPDEMIAPGAYHVVWASETGEPFRLNVKGDYLALVSGPDGRVLHDFGKEYPKQKRDVSFGVPANWVPGELPEHAATHLETPSPGHANSTPLLGEVAKVTLSHKRGFYSDAFVLTLKTKTKGATIRFTTNGARPSSSEGTIYDGPLEIAKTTVLRVGAFKSGFQPAKIKTHTFVIPEDVAQQSPDGLPPEGFPYLWGENHVDYGMDPDVIHDPRFRDRFVDGLTTLPSISLVADMDDLFDAETGIYARAGEDGREWERPCSVEFLNRNQDDQGLQIDAGLRIRGGFSRMALNPKHAFRLFFRDVYGPSKLREEMFPDGDADEFDNLDLRTFQNYSWSYQRDPRAIFLRDQFNRDLQLAMGEPAARGEYYHLFLNGQYWGIYNTCERPKASYGATYLGGKKEDYDAVKKGYNPEARLNVMATDGNLDAWRRLWEQAKAGLASNSAYFRLTGCDPNGIPNPEYEVLLDPKNLIDYMLIIFYGGNLDAPVTYFGGNRSANNWHSMRSRKSRDGFQFFVWDAEHTFLDVNEDRTGPYPAGEEYSNSNPQYLWQQCLENDEFRMLVADRIYAAFFNQGLLTPAVIRERFLARAGELESAVICESARWGDVREHFPAHNRPEEVAEDRIFTQLDWQREIDRVANDYMQRRSGVVLGQLYAQGLWPDVTPPRLDGLDGVVNYGHEIAFEPIAEDEVIYFTLDGTDPRQIGGRVSPRALQYADAIPLDRSTEVRARVLRDGDWSALTTAAFTVAVGD